MSVMADSISYRIRHVAGPLPEHVLEAPLLVSEKPISFLGEVDPQKGVVRGPDGERSLGGRIMVFPQSRGSTVGSYVLYALSYYKKAPKAMVVEKAEPLLITGCVIGGIPLFVAGEKLDYQRLNRCGKAVVRSLGGKEYVLECPSPHERGP